MKFEIYQIKNIEAPYAFMGYDYAIKHGLSMNKDYSLVYEGEIEEGKGLEDIFYMFNVNRPEDFKGHSLSVSDIVKLGNKLYYCNSIGWKRIKQFDVVITTKLIYHNYVIGKNKQDAEEYVQSLLDNDEIDLTEEDELDTEISEVIEINK